MRWAWLVLLGCGCCGGGCCCGGGAAQHPPSTPALPAEPPPAAGAPPPAADPDPDHDRILGVCDLCPNDPETYNGIVDEDGCPDSSGTSHAVIEDPTNRLAYPKTVSFERLKRTAELEVDDLDDRIEVIDVIGRSSAGVAPALAAKRAAIVAAELRLRLPKLAPGARIDEHVTAAPNLYIDEDGPRDVPAAVDVQVMRADGIDIWRWEGDHLVRATPRRRLPTPKLPPGC